MFSGGGLLVAAVMKYSDNVIKSLATGLSVLLSTGASMMLYGTSLSPNFALFATTTVAAIYYFFNNVPGRHAKKWTIAACVYLVLKNLSWAITSVSIESTSFQDSPPMNMIGLVVESEFFPSNWSSSNEALAILRSITNKSE